MIEVLGLMVYMALWLIVHIIAQRSKKFSKVMHITELIFEILIVVGLVVLFFIGVYVKYS